MQIVCWLWRGRGFWKQTASYGPEHVRVLASMLRRHGGHDLACVTDWPLDLPGVERIEMPPAVAALPDYLPKLWAWAPEFHRRIGRRFVSIDLDVVILGDLGPVMESAAPLRIWNQAKQEPYNTSLFALEPGYGNAVWESYSPAKLSAARYAADYWTGDQSWIAHVLGDREETFGPETGVHIYRPSQHQREAPAGAKAMFFCGPFDPASERNNSKWVMDHWTI